MRSSVKKTFLADEDYWHRFREEVRPILEEIVARKIEETRPKWVDSYLSTADKAAGDYKKFDEEKTVMAGQIEDLDDRVNTIENRLQISP